MLPSSEPDANRRPPADAQAGSAAGLNRVPEDLRTRLQRLCERVRAGELRGVSEAQRQERERGEREEWVRELRLRWNAPKRHVLAGIHLEGPWGRHLDALQGRLGKGVLLAFVGPRGTGKTQMAIELMRTVTARGRPALYRTATELLMLLRATYRADARERDLDLLNAHRRPALLVIDEFARHPDNEWSTDVLFELLNQRYADLSDTILVSSQTRAEFESTLGPSLVSRLQEGGGVVECHWPTFRSPRASGAN